MFSGQHAANSTSPRLMPWSRTFSSRKMPMYTSMETTQLPPQSPSARRPRTGMRISSIKGNPPLARADTKYTVTSRTTAQLVILPDIKCRANFLMRCKKATVLPMTLPLSTQPSTMEVVAAKDVHRAQLLPQSFTSHLAHISSRLPLLISTTHSLLVTQIIPQS